MTRLPFSKAELQRAVEAYKQQTSQMEPRTLDVDSLWDEESRMLAEFPETFQEAGCIPERHYLKVLTNWKGPGLWDDLAQENTREELRNITSEAYGLASDETTLEPDIVREQLKILSELDGISAPMGSVLLTFWHPEFYTVMDQRAVASLIAATFWNGKREANIYEYPQYLTRCHVISEETGLSLRDIDRALWQMGE